MVYLDSRVGLRAVAAPRKAIALHAEEGLNVHMGGEAHLAGSEAWTQW
jgi:hypothetical protein